MNSFISLTTNLWPGNNYFQRPLELKINHELFIDLTTCCKMYFIHFYLSLYKYIYIFTLLNFNI